MHLIGAFDYLTGALHYLPDSSSCRTMGEWGGFPLTYELWVSIFFTRWLCNTFTCMSQPTFCGASFGGGARRFLAVERHLEVERRRILIVGVAYFFYFEIIHIQACISDYSSLV
jgi:hypothetical protein